MEREATGQGVRGVIRDAEELADGRHMSLTTGAVETFRDVEDEVRPQECQASREAVIGLQAVHLTHSAERSLHRIDGCGLIPLGIEIWLRKVGSECPTGRLV